MIPEEIFDFCESRSGFTLIELLVVVAIISILTAIAVPQFLRFRQKSIAVEAVAQLDYVYKAQTGFYADRGEYSPGAYLFCPPGVLCAGSVNPLIVMKDLGLVPESTMELTPTKQGWQFGAQDIFSRDGKIIGIRLQIYREVNGPFVYDILALQVNTYDAGQDCPNGVVFEVARGREGTVNPCMT